MILKTAPNFGGKQMPISCFSLLIVEEDLEVRECLSALFQDSGYKIALAASQEEALQAMPDLEAGAWPHAILLGNPLFAAPSKQSLLEKLKSRPKLMEQVPLIVFPSFRVPLPGQPQNSLKFAPACRMSTVSNLLSVVRGLAEKHFSGFEG